MHTICHSRFIEKQGYWFDIIQLDKRKFKIFNTQRKRLLHVRDGIGYYSSEMEFETIEEAKKYLDSLEKKNGQE